MIASEVPTQSGMRTSSGTPAMRNTSYRTGMTIAPPPTPNSPANRPMTMPAATSVNASQISSETGSEVMAVLKRLRDWRLRVHVDPHVAGRACSAGGVSTLSIVQVLRKLQVGHSLDGFKSPLR